MCCKYQPCKYQCNDMKKMSQSFHLVVFFLNSPLDSQWASTVRWGLWIHGSIWTTQLPIASDDARKLRRTGWVTGSSGLHKILVWYGCGCVGVSSQSYFWFRNFGIWWHVMFYILYRFVGIRMYVYIYIYIHIYIYIICVRVCIYLCDLRFTCQTWFVKDRGTWWYIF